MTATSTDRRAEAQGRWPARQGAQLQRMSEAALRVLRRHAPVRSREPMISREGVRAQAPRTRSIMSASIRDQLTGGT
jgi:hypothetical protein